MTKYEYRAIGLSMLAGGAGLAIAVVCQQGHWFGRSGAAITVVAIGFASLKLSDRLAKAPSFFDEQFQSRRAHLLQEAKRGGLSAEKGEAAIRKVEAEMRTEVAEQVRSASRRLLRVEVLLLIAGTLIWGFGDLPLDAHFKQRTADQSVEPTSNSGSRPTLAD